MTRQRVGGSGVGGPRPGLWRAIALALSLAASLALSPRAFAASADSVAAGDLPVPPVNAIAPPRLGGYMQVRETVQKHVGLSAVINRGRFSMDGALPSRFTYRFLVELEASAGAANPATVSLREAIIKWSPAPFAITAGQYKTPFSREYLIPVPLVETADLAAVVDSLAPKYDVGVMGEVAFRTYATAYAGVFNGEGQNSIANRDSTVLGVGRLELTPLPQIAIGGSATYDGPGRNRWGGEVNIEQSGATMRAEVITRHVRGRPKPQDDFGWYVFGGYRVTPRVQAIGRYEDFKRPSLGASRRVRATTYGANIAIANKVRLLLEGLRRYAGASQRRVDSGIVQLQVRF